MPSNLDLNGAQVLLVEDDAILALELALIVESAGGEVVGPVATVQGALRLAEAGGLDAAVLDVQLHDGPVYAALDRLVASGTVVVLYSGTNPPAAVRTHFPQVPVIPKPAPIGALLAALAEGIAARRDDRRDRRTAV